MKPGENLGENFCFMCGRTMMTTSPTTALGVNRYKTTSGRIFFPRCGGVVGDNVENEP